MGPTESNVFHDTYRWRGFRSQKCKGRDGWLGTDPRHRSRVGTHLYLANVERGRKNRRCGSSVSRVKTTMVPESAVFCGGSVAARSGISRKCLDLGGRAQIRHIHSLGPKAVWLCRQCHSHPLLRTERGIRNSRWAREIKPTGRIGHPTTHY